MTICQRGYVTRGEIGYKLDNRREQLRAAEGEGFFVLDSPCGREVYREDNLMVEPTHLFPFDGYSGA